MVLLLIAPFEQNSAIALNTLLSNPQIDCFQHPGSNRYDHFDTPEPPCDLWPLVN